MLLARLSGHSGAGKTRLMRALAARGITCPRAVIYTSRPPRPGEIHGGDYYFLSRGVIGVLPAPQFLVRPVHNMLQAVDLDQLEVDLRANEVVMIEIFHEVWPELVAAMTARVGAQLKTTSVFLSAVDPDTLRNLADDAARADLIRSLVGGWLRWRHKDSPTAVEKRAENAVREILEAIGPEGASLYAKVIRSSPEGPDGEDEWTCPGAPLGRAQATIQEFVKVLRPELRTVFRAVLWDYPEGEPGGGGPDSTLSYDELPKTDWFSTQEEARAAGNVLNRECGDDFFVRVESTVNSR